MSSMSTPAYCAACQCDRSSPQTVHLGFLFVQVADSRRAISLHNVKRDTLTIQHSIPAERGPGSGRGRGRDKRWRGRRTTVCARLQPCERESLA
eukprot:783056-Rhodomonas_salina.5